MHRPQLADLPSGSNLPVRASRHRTSSGLAPLSHGSASPSYGSLEWLSPHTMSPFSTPLPYAALLGAGLAHFANAAWAEGPCDPPTVTLEAAAADEGIQPPRVTQVRFFGDAVTDALPLLGSMVGTLHDPDRLVRVAAASAWELQSKGHLKAKVEVEACVGSRPHDVELVVHISSGPRYTLERFVVTGSQVADSKRFFERPELPGVHRAGGTYVPGLLENDLTRLIEAHVDAGWHDARLGGPLAVSLDEVRREVSIEARILPGTRRHVDSVSVKGGNEEAQALVLQTFGPLRDEFLDRAQLRELLIRIEDPLAAIGYWATVEETDRGSAVGLIVKLSEVKP